MVSLFFGRAGRACLLLFHLVLLGCHSSSRTGQQAAGTRRNVPLDPATPVVTDRARYSLSETKQGEAIRIVSTYRNRTGGTVYLMPCGYRPPRWRLEKQVDGTWVEAYAHACTAVGVERSFPVAPGESRTDTLRVYAGLGTRVFQLEPIPGTYRVVYRIYEAWPITANSRALPEEESTSHSFAIVR